MTKSQETPKLYLLLKDQIAKELSDMNLSVTIEKAVQNDPENEETLDHEYDILVSHPNGDVSLWIECSAESEHHINICNNDLNSNCPEVEMLFTMIKGNAQAIPAGSFPIDISNPSKSAFIARAIKHAIQYSNEYDTPPLEIDQYVQVIRNDFLLSPAIGTIGRVRDIYRDSEEKWTVLVDFLNPVLLANKETAINSDQPSHWHDPEQSFTYHSFRFQSTDLMPVETPWAHHKKFSNVVSFLKGESGLHNEESAIEFIKWFRRDVAERYNGITPDSITGLLQVLKNRMNEADLYVALNSKDE